MFSQKSPLWQLFSFRSGLYLLSVSLVLLTCVWWYSQNKKSRVNFPTVGPKYPPFSYIGAIRFIWGAKCMLQEGYDRYHPGLYRVPELARWHIIATGEYAEEMRRAPDDILSLHAASNEQFQAPYTLGKEIYEDNYHIDTIRSDLTRNLRVLVPEIIDEVASALTDELVLIENEWTKIKPVAIVKNVVSRTSNRVFVGLPKCRDPEYKDLNIQFTRDVVVAFTIIGLSPSFFRPIIGRLFSRLSRNLAIEIKHISPIVEERARLASLRKKLPNVMLSWLINNQGRAIGDKLQGEQSTRDLAIRMLTINFAAMHTTSTTLTHAIYDLASRPLYVSSLREEIETVLAQENGWSKDALDKMVKLDSFLRESIRVNGISAMSSTRKALKDFFFHDGTRIPMGSFISIPSTAIHFDEKHYADAGTFDGFRFARMRGNPEEMLKHQVVSTSPEFVVFGHGRSACPGRFFAAIELKCALAHVILSYDVKMVQEGVRPQNKWYGAVCIPPDTDVLFRRRVP